MKALLNRLTSHWNLAAVWLGLWAWGMALLAKSNASGVYGVLAGLFAAGAAGLLMRRQWARKAGLVAMAAMVCLKVFGMVSEGFTWKQAMYIVGISFIAYCLWKHPDLGLLDDWADATAPASGKGKEEAGSDAPDEESKPIISLVHLRRQQRYLEAPVLAHALSEAWGLNIVSAGGDEAAAEQADGFVAGENPIFMVVVHKPAFTMFTVHNHDQNYFDEAEEVAETVPNLRFAQIIREHEAWLAVDLLRAAHAKLDQDEAYRLIGKAVSALADDDVLAIFCPQHRFFNLWSPALEAMLCGDSPLDALREEVKAPVIGVPDSAVIEAAIAKARERWPEFVACFKNREPKDERFIVKAPFLGEDGQTEHMWLQVFGLEPEYVHGHLMSHPMHTTKLKQGSQVEVPVAEISDWICPDAEGNALGNFTHHAVSQAAKARAQA